MNTTSTLAGLFFGLALLSILAILLLEAIRSHRSKRRRRCPQCGARGIADERFRGIWWCSVCAKGWETES